METPTIYTLTNNDHARKFGLSPTERDKFMQGCFWNRNGGKARAIFCHVQEGRTTSSLRWAIEKPNGQNSYTATVQFDGSILMCIPEQHGPWTNGAVRNPKPAAQKLLSLGGNPNLWTLSIEVEGYWNGEHPKAQVDAAFWLVRYWQKKYGIADEWVFEHADVDMVNRANCAGVYYDTIRARIEAGEGIEDTVTPVETYPKPVPISQLSVIDGLVTGDTAPAVIVAEGIEFTFVYDLLEAVRDTPRLRFADIRNTSKLNRVGPDVKAGTQFVGAWLFKAHDGRRYYYTPHHTRILADDTKRVSDAIAA